MSEQIICHLSPSGGVDERIATLLGDGYTKEDIATLRGLYDMDNPKNPLINPAEEAVFNKEMRKKKELSGEWSTKILNAMKGLMEYKHQQVERHLQEMKSSTKHMASTFNQLYHVPGWNETIRRNRINMVASEFTNEVSRRMAAAKKAGIALTREQIVNGYKRGGQYYEGQLSIFESIFDKFVDRFNEARGIMDEVFSLSEEELNGLDEADKADVERARMIVQEYPKILQNWSALCTFARMTLRDVESVKLGVNTLEYAAPTSPDNFSVDSPLEDTYNLEESVREAWMTHQSETSAFGSLGSEIRRFLSTITDVDETGNKMTDDLGYLIKMDPVETHQYLADILRGITSESSMIRKLKSLSDSDPKVKAVFEALAKASQADLNKSIDNSNKPKNPVILTQLLIDMHKNMVPYTALLKTKAGNVYAKLLNRQANPLHDEFVLRMQLHQSLDRGSSIYDEEGKVDWEKLAQWNVENKGFLTVPNEENKTNLFDNQRFAGFYQASYPQRIEFMKRSARALGIPMTDKAARRIYNNATLRKHYLTALQEFRTETRNAFRGDIKNALEVIEKYQGLRPSVNQGFTVEAREEYDKALETLKSKDVSYETFRTKKYGKNQEKSRGAGNDRIIKMLDALASVDSRLKTERRVSWFDRKGKANSRYSDRTPSYMGDLVDKIHEFVDEGDAQGLKDFIMDKWGKSTFFYADGRFLNKWLQEIYDSIGIDSKGNAIIDPDAMAKIFEFDEFLGSNIDKQVSIFENFTEKQHAEAMIKQFVQMLDQSQGKSKLAKYPCFILGDSGAQMFFTAKRYSKAEIMEGMKDIFRQELERMKYVKATNEVLEKGGFKPIENFSQTANEFTMMKFLNPDFANGKYWKILTGNQQMTDAEMKAMSREEAIDAAKDALGTDALTDAIQSYMDDSRADFMKKLASVGVLEEVKGEGGVITYTDPKGYFSQNIQWFGKSIENLVDDFFWNTKYATIQQLQLFTVDPSFYDHRYPVKDLQKRYKEIYAPGKGISTEARDFDGNLYSERDYEKAVYFDDISVSSEDVNPMFMKLIEDTFGKDSKIAKAYKKNTLTDGQGYRSLSSYRAVKGMAGEWTRPMEEAYKRIMAIRNNGQPLTEADIKEIAQLAVIFQPIKPYLYTLEKLKISEEGQPEDFVLIPVQHKYAEVVLIPELMQEGKLKDMAIWMENNDVDLLASTKCVKVGSFGSTELKGANTTEAINTALDKGLVHNLSWSDYRIQSGVPEHLNHAQLFGTQIRKLILAGIKKGHNYDYLSNILGKSSDPLGPTVYIPGMGKMHLTGRNLVSFYNCLIMGNLFDSYNRFASETTTNQNLSDKMIQNIVSNANQSEDNAFAFSIIEDGENKGQFVVPLGEPGLEHDASALLFSLFKKGVNKQKIKGGSAVQASALGLSGYEEVGDLFEVLSPEGDNVLYDEIEMPWNLSYTSATGKNVGLRFEDWCNPDGTLKMSDQIVYGEDAREYLSWPVSGRDKFGRPNDVDENGYDRQGYYVPLIETKYKGILDIIAYRIPTERDYSMVNAKVFRFSNPLAGGTLKVPSSRTTTAGFDFDIDKLYFFMREFAQTHLSDRDIENIWNSIYDAHPQWKAALQEARVNDQLGKKLLGPIAEMFKDDMSGLGELNEQTKHKDRLYYYWESAGLEGTPEEAFTKYLEDHRDKYPVFDTYNPEASPLNPVKGKDGEIVTPGNSRVARNNMLIDLIRQRLMDKETLKARYTPGGFESNRDAALRMRVLQFADKEDITTNGRIDWAKVDRYVERINDENDPLKDPEPEYDVSDPTAILVYNQQNQVAGKLIAIFANQNTNHVYASTMHELTLREPIKFGNHSARGLYDMLHAPEGVDVDTNVAEYLAASVDAVKDPVLNFLNLNLTTADAGALLARIGYTPQEIGLLFNQPIIKELCNHVANENTTTDVAIKKMLTKYGGSKADLSKIKYDAINTTSDRLADNILSDRTIDKSNMPQEFRHGQLQVLWLFNELMANTADVNSFVQCTKFTAANSVGSTWGDQLAQEEKVREFIEKYMKDYPEDDDPRRLSFKLFDPNEVRSNKVVHLGDDANTGETNQGILNVDEGLLDLTPEKYLAQMSINPLAFEQCMMDMSRKATKTLFKKHFPYYTQLYNNMRSVMRKLTKYGGLDADTINSLHRDFILYLLSKQQGSSFDGEALWEGFEGRSGFTNREFYKEVLPQVMVALKDAGLFTKYPFFEALNITGDSEANLFDEEGKRQEDRETKNFKMTVQGVGGLQSRTSNLLTEAWAQAFNSDESVKVGNLEFRVSDLAKYCYFYNFYRLGYNFHPTSFMSLAPTLLKLGLSVNTNTSEIGYIDFINDVINGNINMDSNDMISFAKQYMLNHLDNKKFIFTPKDDARRAMNNLAYNEKEKFWNTSFTFSLQQLKKQYPGILSQFIVPDDSLRGEKKALRPIIALEKDGTTVYYMADSKSDKFNVVDSVDGSITYRQVFQQGARGQQVQYFSNSNYERFQRSGTLERTKKTEKLQKEGAPTAPAQDTEGGAPEMAPEVTPVEKESHPTQMFTDAEWNQILKKFREKYPQEGQGIHNDDIRRWLSDSSDTGSVQILNELTTELNLGKKMQTLDDQGNIVDVC